MLILGAFLRLHQATPPTPKCQRGCIVGPGFVYELTRSDLVWTARMAHCEIETVLDSDDAPATMWSLVTNWTRRRLLGRHESFGSFVSSYSGCTSRRWATGGEFYSPRITPIADANRRTRWADLPQKTRDYVRSFFSGEIPNRWPGWCIVWTHGYESHAARGLIGPFLAVPDGDHSLNAYYADKSTGHWTAATVRIIPATGASAVAP